eukprot:COSAG06_NODE_40169_length_404_cov_1.452459_1_plen_105_part_01
MTATIRRHLFVGCLHQPRVAMGRDPTGCTSLFVRIWIAELSIRLQCLADRGHTAVCPLSLHNVILGPGAYHMVNRGRSADGEGILGRSRDLHNNNSFPFDPLTNA